ncbi:DUF3006 family protein [Halorubrum salsamenti]|uniref:DUF3006 family protein n=1 Tax=Halorubrum salsamenti TaxID=2583990 RepID=UPI0011A87228|nr:DUF3006 family protein [Halorubrum salsamenti]
MTDIDLADGEYTAVVDTVEDGLATLFFERDGAEVGNAALDVDRLPDKGRHADAILQVQIENGSIATAIYDPERTTTRSEAAQDRFDRLSKRPPRDDRE